ncbi:hypothetical protein [Kitasatospora cathayae]|uniref:ABC transporter substrate-binding protein n=1 Tax=Kitasatospora cathayae TaxID=3004092 RepID=A0ABY7Q5F6_9ACTN|nr:hypothetical protein [Kitasatospora sp. HUAS 3-15]WBP87947.1 hypothetical protein O1G21_20270 [Kitasatospora sp. HUAS 3-15]
MTGMRRFVRKFVLPLAAAAAVLGVVSLANAADSHDAIAVKAAVTVADDISWQ